MAKTTIQKAIELNNWEREVSNMATASNGNYVYTNPNNKYYRFTDNMKGWIEGLFGRGKNEDGVTLRNLAPNEMDEGQKEMANTMKNLTFLQDDWWQVALSGNGAQKESLPKFENTLEESQKTETKEAVYDKLLPAYRALEERFAKRWWFEFIFNHRQYTAERDALKVVTSMILSMTGDSMQQFNDRYEAYKTEVITSNLQEMQQIIERREDFAKAMEKTAAEDQVAENLEEIKQQIKQEEINEIENKSFDEVTTKDQFTLTCNDATFKSRVDGELSAVITELPCTAAIARLRKLMINAQIITPLFSEAEKLCGNLDVADENGANKEGLHNVVKEGVGNMFKVALNATQFLKITDIKERIIVAQKLTDIMLNNASPVSFYPYEYGQYGQGYIALHNEDVIRSALSNADETVVNEAIAGAKETFSALYPENNVQEIEKLSITIEESDVQVVPPVETKPVEIGAPNVNK